MDDDDDDDNSDGKDEIDDPAMEMARNKPILSARCMSVLEPPKELASRRIIIFLDARAFAAWILCTRVLRVEKLFRFSGYFCESVLSLRTECEWNAITIYRR